MIPMDHEFVENGEGVHLMLGEFTICGDAFDIAGSEAEDDHDGEFLPTSKKTVTCSRCAEIIKYCRGVRVNPKPSEAL